MATDNSPPRIKLIATIGVITIVTLVGLDFVLTSYFAYMRDQARHAKLAPTTALDEHRKAEQAELSAGKLTIEQAATELAKGQRAGLIAPVQSDDLGPMTGWSKLPKQAPVAGEAAPAIEDAGAADAVEATDAAADASTDAGVAPTTSVATTDAGVVHAALDAGVHTPTTTTTTPAHDAGAHAPKPAHDAGAVGAPAHP